MSDLMTPEERRRCMSSIRSRDTKPEMAVRRYLFSRGLRYRVGDKRLPGTPDIVMKRYKTVIFIDGCFWHGHAGCRYYRVPHTNERFWRHKITMNMARDFASDVELRLMGWRVIRIWECSLKRKAARESLLSSLYEAIVAGTPFPRQSPSELLAVGSGPLCEEYGMSEGDNPLMAAEPEAGYGGRRNKNAK